MDGVFLLAAAVASLSSCLCLVFLVRARRRLQLWEGVVEAATVGDLSTATRVTLQAIARAMGVRVLYLFAGSQGEPVPLGSWSEVPQEGSEAAAIARRVLDGHGHPNGLRLPGPGPRALVLAWVGERRRGRQNAPLAVAWPAVPLFVAMDLATNSEPAGEDDSIRRFAALGKLAAGVAHELNTPLTTILTSVSRLARSAGDPALERRLQRIKAAVERCRIVVDKLLLYARRPYDLEEQGVTFSRLVWAPVDLGRLVEDTAELHRDGLERAGITLEMDLGEAPVITGDPNALSQALGNLLTRSPESPRRIVISVRAEAGQAVLAVEDEGLDKDPGTRLGLAVAREVVDKHQGQMEVRGEGTSVVLRFPPVGGTEGGLRSFPPGGEK